MKVYIDRHVHWRIEDFYENALLNHTTLDEITVMKKVHRLYDALENLGNYAHIYPLARLKKEWTTKEYKEFICEDFHFAYQIYTLEDGTEIVRIHDALHSLLYK